MLNLLLPLFCLPARAGVGARSLVDANGLEVMINEDVTSLSGYQASQAVSDASFTAAVAASTSAGGTTMSVLEDAYDGYGALSVDGAYYFGNGPGALECGDRQLVGAPQQMGSLSVQRKVFVPADDAFIRWMNILTNTSAEAVTAELRAGNNLGSDADTIIAATSSGDRLADSSDTWAVTMAAFAEGRSAKPRVLHIWGNDLAAIPADSIDVLYRGDRPRWTRTVTIEPGQTIVELQYSGAYGTAAEAELQGLAIASLEGAAVDCLTQEEWEQVVNFGVDCRSHDPDCAQGYFDLSSQSCQPRGVREGEVCDDGLACTTGDVCQSGACRGAGEEEVVGDGVDQDCDGAELCYVDGDGDGYISDAPEASTSEVLDCSSPGLAPASAPGGDCDDADAAISPAGQERCDPEDADEDCDGAADNADESATGQLDYYADADGDGYGDPASPEALCDPVGDLVDNALDCDDANPRAFPGGAELAGDGIDQDCDGSDLVAAPAEGGEKASGGCACGAPVTPELLPAMGILALLVGSRRRR
jgi:hypothetical protein